MAYDSMFLISLNMHNTQLKELLSFMTYLILSNISEH